MLPWADIRLIVSRNTSRQVSVAKARGRFETAPLEACAPTAPAEQTIPDQIAALSELHQRGVLSDAEFAQKKAELLDRM